MRHSESKKSKLEQFDAVRTERDNFMCALHDVMNDKVTWAHGNMKPMGSASIVLVCQGIAY